MSDSTTVAAACTWLAAPDRHVADRPVPLALCRPAPYRPASTIHAHPATPAVDSLI
jgi:hypothetical protein